MMGVATAESGPNGSGGSLSIYTEPWYQKASHCELGYSIASFCSPPQQKGSPLPPLCDLSTHHLGCLTLLVWKWVL